MRYTMQRDLKAFNPKILWLMAWFDLTIIISLVFYFVPVIDLNVASWFVNESGFYLNRHPLFMAIHNSVSVMVMSLSIFYIVLLISNMVAKRTLIKGFGKRQLVYLIIALIVGPGLVVNSLLKENWGRARPLQVEQFGGQKQFSPAFVMTDQCESNCSFVSGDAASGFYLVSFVLLFGRRLLWLPLVVGGIFAATRVIQGAHFFSDVILSGIFTAWVCYVLYVIFFYKEWAAKYLSKPTLTPNENGLP
jgi:lipid A 4'-phosphatase